MATTYSIYKPKTKERFELDKGYGWILINWNFIKEDINGYSKEVVQLILYMELLKNVSVEFDKDTKLKYFNNLSKKILNWIGNDNFIICSDETFYDEYKDDKITKTQFDKTYPITGTRFDPELFR